MNVKLISVLTGAGLLASAGANLAGAHSNSDPLLHLSMGAAAAAFCAARTPATRVFLLVLDLWYAGASSVALLVGASAPSQATDVPGWNAICMIGLGLAIACGLAKAVEPGPVAPTDDLPPTDVPAHEPLVPDDSPGALGVIA